MNVKGDESGDEREWKMKVEMNVKKNLRMRKDRHYTT